MKEGVNTFSCLPSCCYLVHSDVVWLGDMNFLFAICLFLAWSWYRSNSLYRWHASEFVLSYCRFGFLPNCWADFGSVCTGLKCWLYFLLLKISKCYHFPSIWRPDFGCTSSLIVFSMQCSSAQYQNKQNIGHSQTPHTNSLIISGYWWRFSWTRATTSSGSAQKVVVTLCSMVHCHMPHT